VKQQLHHSALFGVAAGLLLSTAPAEAYIGPGAGLSLLGALWALIAAIAAAVMFIVLWPFRTMIKRRAAQKQAVTAPVLSSVSETPHGAPQAPTC
jgi:hypothetical protein